MGRRRFERNIGTRRYKRIIIISAEGCVTEREYFQMFNSGTFVVKYPKHISSAPNHVLRAMKKYLKDHPLRHRDQAWIVIDKDQWQEGQIKALYDWSGTHEQYDFALSNPKFEYWLLLHFEDAKNIKSSKNCSDRLKKYLPEYDKKIEKYKVFPYVQDAIDRAESHDRPACKDWPRNTGTTVYKLVKKLLP